MSFRLAALVLALAAAASAEEAAPIRATVQLRDGRTVHGTVKKLRLGKSITLSLPAGKSTTLDDADIVQISLAGGAAPADDAAASPPAAAAADPKAASASTRAPPAAPPSDLDTVYLSDGGLLRGTIETEKPDLVIRLLSGKKRTVPAASVQRIERRKKP